jgi:choline dehydrogenase
VKDDWDYVVVGSGAGGGPLAARLAVNGFKVLLLEAGDDQGANVNVSVPTYHAYSTEDPKLAWNYYVRHYADLERQKRDSKFVYKTPNGLYVGLNPPPKNEPLGILYPRAATLGGCSAHNAMVSIYNHRSDWSNIERLTGDSSWHPDNMRKYLERLEDCHYCEPLATGHGKKGWLGIDRADLTLALTDKKLVPLTFSTAMALGKEVSNAFAGPIANALKALAVDINSADPERDQREGLYQIPIHTRNNQRNSARDFIVEVANAQNPDGSKKFQLYVQLNTLATKVVFKSGPSGRPRANGVEYLHGTSLYKADPRWTPKNKGAPGVVYAKREVIVSGGVYGTPQLLKLSGVGPAAELAKFNIPLVVDLPGVGRNLQDHYEIGVVDQTELPFDAVASCTFGRTADDACLKQWEYASPHPGAYQSNGFFLGVVKKTAFALHDPDILMFGGVASFRGYYNGYSEDAYGRNKWTWAALRAHTPNNGGTIKLKSADPTDTPEITFNYFDTAPGGVGQADVNALIEAVGLARKTFPSPHALAGDNFTELIPGPEIDTPEKLDTYIKDESWGHHASCSVPIGADNDPFAVLDSKFRVRGVDGLRVVDASVFPNVPGFFIVLPTYMIGEKAAEDITAAAQAH